MFLRNASPLSLKYTVISQNVQVFITIEHSPDINIVTRMSGYRRGLLGLVNRFIDHLQVVTTNTYTTIAISILYKITLILSQPSVSAW
jgi:hypothetical protein